MIKKKKKKHRMKLTLLGWVDINIDSSDTMSFRCTVRVLAEGRSDVSLHMKKVRKESLLLLFAV